MTINPALIKGALNMLGIDLNTIAQKAIPIIKEQLDKALTEIPVDEGESKGIVIVPNDNGEYFIVRTKFKPNANQSMVNVSHCKLNDLLTQILTSLKNG